MKENRRTREELELLLGLTQKRNIWKWRKIEEIYIGYTAIKVFIINSVGGEEEKEDQGMGEFIKVLKDVRRNR